MTTAFIDDRGLRIKWRGPNTEVMNPMHTHKIVFANEKGGTGKSTTAVHAAVALCAAGYRVAALDMDVRQKTLVRYLDNRAATMRRRGLDLPMPGYDVLSLLTPAGLEQEVARLGHGCDYVMVDTPGRDDPLSRAAIALADTLVTPINDSFVDLDLIGQVEAETFKVSKPSFYAELIWDLRKVRAKTDGGSVDWDAPPEQMTGQEVYPATDLYALAVTCITLLSGLQPDRKSTRLNSSHSTLSRMPSSA